MIQVAVSSIDGHVSPGDPCLDRAIDFIRTIFCFVHGVVEVSVDQKGDCLLASVSFSEDAIEGMMEDMIFPEEVGLRFRNPILNGKKAPRLWLMYQRAKASAEKLVKKRCRADLTFMWASFVQRRNGTVIRAGL